MRWLVPLVLLSALQARAHDADIIFVLVKPGAQPDLLVETVTLTAATLALLAPLDADEDQLLSQGDLDAKTKALKAGFWDEAPLTAAGKPCALEETKAFLREGFVELQGELRCPEGELRQDFKILRVIPANYRVVLGSQLAGERGASGFAQGSLSAIPIPRPPPPGSWDQAAFGRAFELGVERGLSGVALAAVFSVLLSLAAWRRGAMASALMLCGILGGSFLSLDWWTASALMLLIAGGAALRPPPLIVPALLGLSIGLREAGGGWSGSLGLGLGSSAVLLFSSPVALALGVMLHRRPKVHRVVRWVPLGVAVISAAARARLSW